MPYNIIDDGTPKVIAYSWTSPLAGQIIYTPTVGKKLAVTDVILQCTSGQTRLCDNTDSINYAFFVCDDSMDHTYKKPYVQLTANRNILLTTISTSGSLVIIGVEI